MLFLHCCWSISNKHVSCCTATEDLLSLKIKLRNCRRKDTGPVTTYRKVPETLGNIDICMFDYWFWRFIQLCSSPECSFVGTLRTYLMSVATTSWSRSMAHGLPWIRVLVLRFLGETIHLLQTWTPWFASWGIVWTQIFTLSIDWHNFPIICTVTPQV